MKVRLRKIGNREVKIEESIFIVRVLDAEEEAEINDELFRMDDKSNLRMSTSSVALAMVKKSLIGWSNVVDGDGKDVDFSESKVKILPTSVLNKICEAARGERLPEEEEKN